MASVQVMFKTAVFTTHKTAQRTRKPIGYLSGEVTPVLKFEIYFH